MRRSERIEHEDVPALREALRGDGIVLRLSRIEAGVLEHLDPPVGQQLLQTRRDRRHRERGVGSLRPSQVRTHGDVRGVALEEVPEGRQGGTDPGVVGDTAVLEGNVQVGADEHALPRDVSLADGARAVHYGRSLPITSTSRHE